MALEEAKEANEAKQSFLSKMSYDIRRPVNVKDILNTLKESKYTITSKHLRGLNKQKNSCLTRNQSRNFLLYFLKPQEIASFGQAWRQRPQRMHSGLFGVFTGSTFI